MSKVSKRHEWAEFEASELVAEGPTRLNTMIAGIDETNEGDIDMLQAGVVAETGWSFTASIVEATAELGFAAEIAESIAWLPDPVISKALMRTVTAKSKPAGEVSPVKPAEGKYVAVAYELVPTVWNKGCTVKLHAGTEAASEAEAIAKAPVTTTGRIQVRRVVIKNTGGKYKIESQTDVRPWATGGTAPETVAQGKVGSEAITDSKIVKGRALVETENTWVTAKFCTKAECEAGIEVSSTRSAIVVLSSAETAGWQVGIKNASGTVLIGAIESAGGGMTFLLPPGQKWKFETGVFAAHVLI